MKPLRLNDRDRRALITGSLAVVAMLVYSIGFRPHLGRAKEIAGRISVESGLLQRELAVVAQADQIETAIAAQRRHRLMMERRLFREAAGASPIGFEQYVIGIAARSSVQVEQSDSRSLDLEGRVLRPLRVDLRAVSDFQGIETMLHALETGEKLIKIDDIQLQSMPPATEGAERIGITLRLTGYALPAVGAEGGESQWTREDA